MRQDFSYNEETYAVERIHETSYKIGEIEGRLQEVERRLIDKYDYLEKMFETFKKDVFENISDLKSRFTKFEDRRIEGERHRQYLMVILISTGINVVVSVLIKYFF